MGKRIIISEEEKNKIKELYKINESWVDDVFSFLKDKGENVVDYFSDLFKDEDEKDDEKKDDEKKEKDDEKKTEKDVESELNKKTGKEKEEIIKKTTKEVEKEWKREGRYDYYLPSNYKEKKVHLLVAGTDTNSSKPSTQTYKTNIDKSGVLNGCIFVITDINNSISSAEEFVSKKFGKNISSIAGFSGGSFKVFPEVGNKKYNLVGLIDPSCPSKFSYEKKYKEFGTNTYMVCDPSNWGGDLAAYGKNLKEYCKHADSSGGRIYCVNTDHHTQLKEFYDLHKGKL